jgi:hypothetical protein
MSASRNEDQTWLRARRAENHEEGPPGRHFKYAIQQAQQQIVDGYRRPMGARGNNIPVRRA